MRLEPPGGCSGPFSLDADSQAGSAAIVITIDAVKRRELISAKLIESPTVIHGRSRE